MARHLMIAVAVLLMASNAGAKVTVTPKTCAEAAISRRSQTSMRKTPLTIKCSPGRLQRAVGEC